ncbi:hypothetical protein Lser_V15G03696 [Lactuca serriola]
MRWGWFDGGFQTQGGGKKNSVKNDDSSQGLRDSVADNNSERNQNNKQQRLGLGCSSGIGELEGSTSGTRLVRKKEKEEAAKLLSCCFGSEIRRGKTGGDSSSGGVS